VASPTPVTAIDYVRLAQTVFSQRRVKDLCLVVVGAGALGNEVVKTLGLLGVGKVTVVDPDTVEAADLTRSPLLRGEDVMGRNKAAALADCAGRLFPDTAIIGISKEIADVGFQELVVADLIFGCVDNDLARLEVAYISTQLDVPVLDGGLGAPDYSRGRVSFFPGSSDACFSCRLTQQRRRELLTVWEAASRPCWFRADDLERLSYPSTPTMAAVVGALQVELGLRRLLETQDTGESPASTVEIVLDAVPKLAVFSMSLSQTCPFHEPGRARIRVPGSSSATVRSLLNQAEPGAAAPGDRGSGPAALVLDWPICASARCVECDQRWSPMLRLAALRKSGACPRCGSRRFVEEQTLRAIEGGSQWADRTFGDLGLPEAHLHLIQRCSEPVT
jgi:molybdopterin-synthase adenylyltransferase